MSVSLQAVANDLRPSGNSVSIWCVTLKIIATPVSNANILLPIPTKYVAVFYSSFYS